MAKGKLEYFYADDTKTHSQEPNLNKNDLKVTLGINNHGEKVLLDVNVNKSWSDMNEEIEKQKIIRSDACLIADAELELRKALSFLTMSSF
ncbi:MAG: hypothetical protein LBB45_06095 [Methanobrevibacter sp.]|jgi:hypothetical protein|nr:hypothetical protein [Candidatus Methanovirga basalitermitum]